MGSCSSDIRMVLSVKTALQLVTISVSLVTSHSHILRLRREASVPSILRRVDAVNMEGPHFLQGVHSYTSSGLYATSLLESPLTSYPSAASSSVSSRLSLPQSSYTTGFVSPSVTPGLSLFEPSFSLGAVPLVEDVDNALQTEDLMLFRYEPHPEELLETQRG